jgi:hypothetical protein
VRRPFSAPFSMKQRKLKTKEQIICMDAPVQAPVEERMLASLLLSIARLNTLRVSQVFRPFAFKKEESRRPGFKSRPEHQTAQITFKSLVARALPVYMPVSSSFRLRVPFTVLSSKDLMVNPIFFIRSIAR